MCKVVLIGSNVSSLLNFRLELIKDLVSKNVEVFCFVDDFSVEQKDQIVQLGAKLLKHKLNSKGLNPFHDLLAVYFLVRQLRSINPDVVFSYFVKPVIFGTLAAKLVKVPRVIGMIEGLGNSFTATKEGYSFKSNIIRNVQILLYRLSLPKLDSLILLNSDDKKDLIDTHKIFVKDIFILGAIGVDLEKFRYTSQSVKPLISFIFVGRLLREKGIFEYLSAAEIVKKSFPNTTFYVLGGLDAQNPFALKASDLDPYLKSGIVNYMGNVTNVLEYLQKSNVFVLPSYREGFPRSTQEAMAVGRAVITTDVPGCRETVVDGINGFLVPPYDVTELAASMKKIVENPDWVPKMGLNSRIMAEKSYNVYDANKKIIKILFSG